VRINPNSNLVLIHMVLCACVMLQGDYYVVRVVAVVNMCNVDMERCTEQAMQWSTGIHC